MEYLHNPKIVCPLRADSSQPCSLLEVVRRIVPAWGLMSVQDEQAVRIEPLTGGITNVLFKLTPTLAAGPPTVIVRLFGEGTELFVDRDIENVVFSELSRLEMGSPIFYGLFENGRVEGFLDSRALAPEEMHDPRIYRRIASAVAMLHSQGSHIRGLDCSQLALFPKMRRFFALASQVSFPDSQRQEQLAALGLEDKRRQMEQLDARLQAALAAAETVLVAASPDAQLLDDDDEIAQAAATVLAFQGVLCHNDLLSGNVLLSLSTPVDEPGSGGVTLIDFEYAAWNARGWDLANHWCEFAGFDSDFARQFPEEEKRREYLYHYLDAAASANSISSMTAAGVRQLREWAALRKQDGQGAAAKCARFVAALDRAVCWFLPCSHIFWGSWCVLQAAHSTIEFDFLQYSRRRFDGLALHQERFGLEIERERDIHE